MECNIHKAKEERHPNKWLEINPEQETPRLCDGQDDCGVNEIILHQALEESIGLLLQPMDSHLIVCSEARAVHANAEQQNHKIFHRGAVDIILIERIRTTRL